jgi:hypothetical protein
MTFCQSEQGLCAELLVRGIAPKVRDQGWQNVPQ